MGSPGEWKAELAAGGSLLLAATYACGSGVSALIYYSFGLFVQPLQQAFGWSRGEVASTMLFGSLGLVLAAPCLGWLIDRLGARRIALVSIPAFALMLTVLSRFDGPRPAFYALFFAVNVAGIGTSSILYTRAVAGSFDRARGLALGILLAGPGIAAIVLPPLMQYILSAHGWRWGFLTLAAIAAAPWPLAWTWLRPLDGVGARAGSAVLHGMARGDALRSSVFWTLSLGFAATAVACAALIVHMVPMLRDAGLEPGAAAKVASLVGIGVLIGRLGIGWLIDRLFAPRVAATIFVIAASGAALLLAAGPKVAPVAAFLTGFALGAEVDLLGFLASRYFGMRHFGFIYATIYAMFWIASSLGPAVAGRLYDAYGNYRPTLWLVIVMMMVGAVAALRLPRYAR